MKTSKFWTYKLHRKGGMSQPLPPAGSFKIQAAACTSRPALPKVLYPDTGSELQSLHTVLEHILFIPVPDSNKVTTEETLGSAVWAVPK